MIKYLLLAFLVVASFSAYNATKAKSLAYICASTFGTEAEINGWTCKYCKYNNLTNVHLHQCRLRPSTIPSSISSASLDTTPAKTLLSSPLEAPSASKIGLSILMPPKYFLVYAGALSRMLRLPSSSRLLQCFRRSGGIHPN